MIESAMPGSKNKKLVDLCRTRWVEKHAALETFAEMYQIVNDCLGQMAEMGSEFWDADTLTRASGFIQALRSSGFLVAFVIARKGLQYIKPPTVKLQKKARDISSAYHEIGEVTSCIQGLRESVDITFAQWFGECNNMAQSCGQDITIPRQCQRQTLRDNHSAVDAEEFFRRSLAMPFLDYLSSELQSRFSHPQLAADGLALVPTNVVENAAQGFTKIPDGIQGLASLWEADLPSICELEAEYNRWVCK